MAQHDYVIANDTAANVRSDLNDALSAIVSQNSGGTAPSTTYANMLWYDTANNILKMRSEADDAWINVGYLDQSSNAFRILDDTQVVNTSGTQTGLLGDQSEATWETGTSTTESLVSPAKVKAAIDANAGKTWLASVATTSGTSIDVTSLPAGIREITIKFIEVSTNGSANILVQLGTSGGFVTSGYDAYSGAVAGAASSSSTSGMILRVGASDREQSGSMRLFVNESDVWVSDHTVYDTNVTHSGAGVVSLGGTLTQIRLTTTGSDTFDNGEIVVGYQ